jgi:hypothetical protein
MNEKLFLKIVGMFRPYGDKDFLSFKGEDTICGPNDRAMYGFDTNFPKEWLVTDYGFTNEEADEFVELVKKAHSKETTNE